MRATVKGVVEAHAGSEPEWLMARALLTVDGEAEAVALVANVETCERGLFLGAWRLKHADGNGAARAFIAAQAVCPLDSIEGSETRVELGRLRAGG